MKEQVREGERRARRAQLAAQAVLAAEKMKLEEMARSSELDASRAEDQMRLAAMSLTDMQLALADAKGALSKEKRRLVQETYSQLIIHAQETYSQHIYLHTYSS